MKEKVAPTITYSIYHIRMLLKVTEALEICLQNELPGEQNHSCSSVRPGIVISYYKMWL
jgi:hypothetical protein